MSNVLPKYAKLLKKFDSVLALDIDRPIDTSKNEIPQEVIELAEKRLKARKEKNWAESDSLRDEIKEKGYEIEDTKDGYQLK